MLTDKQIKLLKLLCTQIYTCKKCGLYVNGRATPYWTPSSRYLIIGEAPGYHETRSNIPFVGSAGKVLTDVLTELNYKREDFCIINSVNCRPVEGMRNGKPIPEELDLCQDWLRKFIKVINPEKIICLGNYAKYFFTKNTYGVLRERGNIKIFNLDNKEIPYIVTVHPAYCLYNDQGIEILKTDFSTFKGIQTYQSDFLSEDDFIVV
jgi:DNA polymerase